MEDTQGEPLTKEEALAFLEAWRQMFAGKVGFKHLADDLQRVADYVRSTSQTDRIE